MLEKIAKFRSLGSKGGGWNDLKDKPFGEETKLVNEPLNITWDGNTEGLASIPMGGRTIYHVSDAMPTLEQMQSASFGWCDGSVETLEDADIMVQNEQVLMLSFDGLTFGVLYTEYNGCPSGLYIPMEGEFFCTSFTTTEPVEYTKTVVKKIDEKYLPEHLQFGEEIIEVGGDTLTWDGNTEGLYTVGDMFVKISDATPTKEDFVNGCIRETSDSGKMNIESTKVTTMESALLVGGESILIIPEDNSIVGGMSFEEAGVYTIINHYDRFVSLTIPNYTGFKTVTEIVHKLDPKYLPDDIGGGGGGVEIIEATIKEGNKKCLILPITTTEIAQQIASGKDVAIKAVIANKEGQTPETVLFRFASMNEENSVIYFVAFKPYFTMSAGQMLGACVLEMGYGEPQTEAWLSYTES